MKNSIKLLLLSFITPLLCIGVSFGVAPGFTDSSYSLNLVSQGTLDSNYYSIDNLPSDKPFCVSFYNAVSPNNYDGNFDIRGCGYNVNRPDQSQCGLPLSQNIYFRVATDSRIFCFDPRFWSVSMSDFVLSSISVAGTFGNYSLTSVDYNVYLFDNSSLDCSSVESQLSECQSNYSSLKSSYNTLSGNLATCNSDLTSCTNSCDTLVSQCQNEKNQCLSDKSDLQTTYSGCLESLSSLNEYNNSLNQQLQECLLSGSSSGDLTIYEYQLSRNDGYGDLFLPITNSIQLPYGYRGFLDDGVLAIKSLNSLETAYTINNEDFNEDVIGSYGTIFLFFMSLGLFLVFVYAIRRYFIGLKSIK